MTALRVRQRETFVEELEGDLPWVPASDFEEMADVIPIERPKLSEMFRRLADVMPLFDADDLAELTSELADALDHGALNEAMSVINGWRITGESLRDADARDVLRGDVTVDDFIEAPPFDS